MASNIHSHCRLPAYVSFLVVFSSSYFMVKHIENIKCTKIIKRSKINCLSFHLQVLRRLCGFSNKYLYELLPFVYEFIEYCIRNTCIGSVRRMKLPFCKLKSSTYCKGLWMGPEMPTGIINCLFVTCNTRTIFIKYLFFGGRLLGRNWLMI